MRVEGAISSGHSLWSVQHQTPEDQAGFIILCQALVNVNDLAAGVAKIAVDALSDDAGDFSRFERVFRRILLFRRHRAEHPSLHRPRRDGVDTNAEFLTLARPGM